MFLLQQQPHNVARPRQRGNRGRNSGARSQIPGAGKWLLALLLLALMAATTKAADEKTVKPSIASPLSTLSSKTSRDEIYIDDEGTEGSGGHGIHDDDVEKEADYSGSGFGPDDEDASTDHHNSHNRRKQTQLGNSQSNRNNNDNNDFITTSRVNNQNGNNNNNNNNNINNHHQSNSGTIIGSTSTNSNNNNGIIGGSDNSGHSTGINTIGKDSQDNDNFKNKSSATTTTTNSSIISTTTISNPTITTTSSTTATINNNNSNLNNNNKHTTTTSSLYPPVHPQHTTSTSTSSSSSSTTTSSNPISPILPINGDNDDDEDDRDDFQIDGSGDGNDDEDNNPPFPPNPKSDETKLVPGSENDTKDNKDTDDYDYDSNESHEDDGIIDVDGGIDTSEEHEETKGAPDVIGAGVGTEIGGHDNKGDADRHDEDDIFTVVTDPNDNKEGSTQRGSGINNQGGIQELDPNNVNSLPTDTKVIEHTTGNGNEVLIMNASDEDRTTSFFAQPGILAAVIGGAVVGLLCAILVVMFIVYRMRKKDEGSYALDEPKRSPAVNSYAKNANNREFYA